MKKTFISSLKKFLLSLVIGSVLGVLFTGYMAQGQFIEPTTNPPGGADPAPPLTTTDDSQVKDGPLILNFTSPGNDTGMRVYGYLQIDTIATLPDPGGTPEPTHCDNLDDVGNPVEERGRMILEPDNGFGSTSLWICSSVDVVTGHGWVEK